VTLAPPRPPSSDELEALIREARTRQRKRWLGAAVCVALFAGAALAAHSIAAGGSSDGTRDDRGRTAVKSAKECGIRVAGPRILGSGGRTVYREPIRHEIHPNSIPSQVRCSASAIWVVWHNGVAASQESYVGARSVDRGRTWKLVFAERFFGVKAPHELDAYMGPWSLRGHVAYFMGSCPACSTTTLQGTISLWVTKDAGRTFRMYKVPALTGYAAVRLRVSDQGVRIFAKRFIRGVEPQRKTVTIHLG
jgi:hypothetical protein